MSRAQNRSFDPRPEHAGRRRHRRAPAGERRPHPVPLTPEGTPASAPDAPRPSPVVVVAEASRAAYPWLPRCVIAGSVWRGPSQERVKVDESGVAAPWRSPVAAAR